MAINPEDMMEHGGPEPQGEPVETGMPSQQEIMMAGMIALGLMPPPGGQGQPPQQGQPMQGGNPNARIAQQLMGGGNG